jgi:hypothetical protein
MSEYQSIPVKAAKQIAVEHAKDIVVIVAWSHEHHKFHTVTYGVSPNDKVSAANAGEIATKALGGNLQQSESYEDFRTHEHAAKMTAENETLKQRMSQAHAMLKGEAYNPIPSLMTVRAVLDLLKL